MTASLRDLPAVDAVLASPLLADFRAGPLRTGVVREALAEARAAVRDGAAAASTAEVAARAAAMLLKLQLPSPRRTINATGVILHTNLGRAPLSEPAIAAMVEAAGGYSDLEYDLASGQRSSRFDHLEELLRRVTGAEAGIAVNNNASAILLMLSTLCYGREVIVSRGQAVEIGGGFRIPDVLRQSGATLVEVGTTNRTSVRDFAGAITERTAALLRVHASNFRVVGFTAFPELGELASVARERGVLLLDDLGSGCLLDTRRFGMLPEPTVQDSVSAGADVAAFSGDKLLGGPQAGILVGKSTLIAELRRHPLARAVRMDKLSIAALAATLRHYLLDEAMERIPVWRMIDAPLAGIHARARRWARASILPARVEASRSMIGGGSLPGEGVETRVVAIASGHAERLATTLRHGEPPIVARVDGGCLLLDPRTVEPRDDARVRAALARLQPA